MASIFRPLLLLRPQILGVGLGLSLATSYQLMHLHRRPMKLDSSPAAVFSTDSYRTNAKTPVLREGSLNPNAVRQISTGSVIGLCAGILVSTFSRPLALLIGLAIVGIQWASSYGVNVLPYDRIQRYVTDVDLRSAVQDNVAFKLSFGSTFALAAFFHF